MADTDTLNDALQFVKDMGLCQSTAKVNEDGTVSADQVFLNERDFERFPVRFRRVYDFFAMGCPNLVSLDGSPEVVANRFDIRYCTSLVSLAGGPKYARSFDCAHCTSLVSLEGCPKEVENFYCNGCGRKFTEDEVRALCNVKGNVVV